MEEISFKSVVIGLLASFGYWYYSLVYNPTGLLGINTIGNIKAYFILCFIFAFICLCAIVIQTKLKLNSSKSNIFLSGILYVLFAIASYDIIHENTVLTNRVGILIEVIVIIFSLLVFIKLYKEAVNKIDESNRFLNGFFITIVALVWYQNVAVNNLFIHSNPQAGFDIIFNVHHGSAYIDSIYAVWQNSPFMGGITEQYGHYALFFIIPMKLFGASLNTIGKMMGLISALAGGLFVYCFFKVVKNNVSKILFGLIMIGVGIFPSCTQIYWQTYPQRFLAPAITIGYILYICEKELKLKYYLLGLILMCFNFLWSTDSGLVCVLVYVAFYLIKSIRDRVVNKKTITTSALMALVNIVVPLLGALGIVNIYNTIVGGKCISFIDYLTLDNEGYIQSLQVPIDFWSNSYSYKLIFLLTVIGVTTISLLFITHEKEYKKNVYFFVNATIGLGMLTYFVNRPIAGSDMIDPYTYVCYFAIIQLLSDNLLKSDFTWIKDKFTNNIRLGMVLISFIFIFIECQNYIKNFYFVNYKNEAGAYNYNAIVDSSNEIKEYLDKDVVGVGIGTSALFFELGIDKKSYRFDVADMADVWNGNQVFMWRGYEEEYLPENYALIREFVVNDMSFGIYEQI